MSSNSNDEWQKVLDEKPKRPPSPKTWSRFFGAALGYFVGQSIGNALDGIADRRDERKFAYQVASEKALRLYQADAESERLIVAARDLHASVSLPSREDFASLAFVALSHASPEAGPLQPIYDAMLDFVVPMYDLPSLNVLPQPPSTRDSIPGARYRDALRLYIDRFADIDTSVRTNLVAVTGVFIRLVQLLPPQALGSWKQVHGTLYQDPLFLIPLSDVIDRRVLGVLSHLHTDEVKRLDLFRGTRNQLEQNIQRYSWRLTKRDDKIIEPSEHPGTLAEAIDDALSGTPLHALLTTQCPFSIPRSCYLEHGLIVAGTGSGKTQLLQTLILDFLQNDPPGMFVIDSQGSMLKTIMRAVPETIAHRVDYISPAQAPPLNLFKLSDGHETGLNELFVYLFGAIDASLTAKQGTALSYLLRLMHQLPNSTLTTLLDVMESNANKYSAAIGSLDSTAQNFFANQFYGGGMKDTRVQVARRLYALLANPLFAKMFDAPDNSFNAFRALQERRITLIDTSEELLGKDSSLFGRFFVANILAAAYKRPETQRPMALLIVDEAQPYFDTMTERILAQARKFGLGGLWATQNLDQITDTVRSAMFGNTTVRFAGGLSHKDANAMANEMYTTGDRIRSLRKVDREYAEFACHIKNITPVAVKLQVPFGRMEAAAVRELPVFQKPVGSTEATTLPSSSPKPEPGTQPTQARQQPSSNAEAASPPVDPSTPSKW